MSAKTVKRIHINRAEIKQIKRWQHNAKRRISRLESNKFAVIVFDEAIFIDDPASRVKYQSKKGEPIVLAYKGRHGRVVVVVVAYGSIATDGRQFFRTYDRFDKETVLQYIKELARHFKKVAIIMDNAPQHKACILQEFLDGNSNVKVIWMMPTATPEVSVTEERSMAPPGKAQCPSVRIHATVGEMRMIPSEYFRTARLEPDVIKFISKSPLAL